jgi:membrane associated rhomboid family serine protease
MRRSPPPYVSSFSFGPGPLSTALKGIILANVLIFFAQVFVPSLIDVLALRPAMVLRNLWVWQLASYMFLHAGLLHILFNMLALWMFGTELERMWGMREFLKFYFACGVGAALLTIGFALLPFDFSAHVYRAATVGASGAVYGLLLAYALYFPDRPILLYFLFPVPAKIFVLIMGGIAFYASLTGGEGGVANATHLGGLVIAYFYLKAPRVHPLAELNYRYSKWKLNRLRKKFDVYSGGRADDWDRRVH